MQNPPPTLPIQFQTPEEFQSRENYSSELNCDVSDLSYIVGKYGFSQKQKLQCGLNGCHNWHWHGFVIATKSGKETHCGQNCGSNAFGITWDDLHAAFKKKEEERDSALALQRIQEEARTTLTRCNQLIEECTPLSKRVQYVDQRISRESALKRVFDSAIKSDGRIFTEAERSAFMYDSGNKGKNRDMVVLAVIEGSSSVSSSKYILHTLTIKVKKPVEDLLQVQLENLSPTQVKQHLDALKEFSGSLTQAQNFVAQAEKFLTSTNLQKIKLLVDQLPKRARTDRMRRIADGLGA